jgi:hypothetical protein
VGFAMPPVLWRSMTLSGLPTAGQFKPWFNTEKRRLCTH